ncbi:MAG: type I glutamate--ammonia ligase [Candidatus Bipolaricaulota bacterium]|nr:MAG: type I glutamate--ammonia ligase [Candidatus Bipolaricaulota bacterium]
MATLEELQQHLADEQIEFVDLRVTDLVGRWRHVTIPADRLDSSLLERGVAFDASNLGFAAVEGSDMVLRPDPATAAVTLSCGGRVLSMLCDVFVPQTNEPFPGDPRAVARRAEAFVAAEGGADAVRMSPELEFYVFRELQVEAGPCRSGVVINPMHPHGDHSFYHVCPPRDRLFALRNEICRGLIGRGFDVRYHHHEVGAHGQVEIELGFHGLTDAADATLIAKDAARCLAADAGWEATFLPKPIHDQNGSGLHVHQFLERDGSNLFSANGELSELALCYIGGLLSHGRSLCALSNPSTNSYRRLVPGFEAPVWFAFGEGNRSAAVRIPRYADGERRRIELRTADATCNPYLAFAAMLMAGLDGIARGLNATDLGLGPFDRDLYRASEESASPLVAAPRDLHEALDALEADHEYLFAGGVFTSPQIEQWVRTKRGEAEQVQHRPHPYEFVLYHDL